MQRKIRATAASAPLVGSLLLAGLLGVVVGCSPASEGGVGAAGSGGSLASGGAANTGGVENTGGAITTGGVLGTGGAGSASGGAGSNPLGRARCRAPAGVNASPKSTQEAVDLLNALPKPTGVACFLESLERPLIAYASSSVFSAQPAFAADSPRVFIKLGQLWLSVVIDGEGSHLMEFGELLVADPFRSIKGELELPVNEPVGPSDPYDRVFYDNGTMCRFCHQGEQPAEGPGLFNAFSSIALKPRDDTRVMIENLKRATASCNWQVQPNRCEMLSALFDGGEVVEQPFPEAMPTFF